MDPLIKMLDHLQPRKPLVFPNDDEAARLPHQENQNVLLTSPSYLNDCLNVGYMHANNISVVIFLTTIKTRLSASDHSAVLKTLCKEGGKPRIIGLVQLGLNDVCNALDLKTKLDFLKATYDLPIFMSKDLLAMNAYGEEIAVKVLRYSLKSLSETEKKIWKILHQISVFLQDIIVMGISKSIRNVRAIVAWSIDVLMMFGLWSLSFKLDCIQNTLSNKLQKESHPIEILAIEACKTEFEIVQHLVKSQQKAPPVHSCLIYEICDQLAPYKVLCNTAATSATGIEHTKLEIGADLFSEKKLCARDMQTAKFEEDSSVDKSLYESTDIEEACHGEEKFQRKESIKNSASSNKREIVEKQVQKVKNKSQFHCIIVTQNNSFARMLSKLINYVSACNKEYSFMKSGCVIHSKNTNSDEEERTESVLQAVLQGMVNILVTTMDMVSDLSLTTFNVLVYFGVPVNYQQYYHMKNKIRGLAAKLMLILNDDYSVVCERNLRVFSNIESEIARRVPGYISQENKEKWLKFLSKEPQLKYAPFGEDGTHVSMESSIQIVNRYCRRICRGDFCTLTAQFMTEKKDVTKNCVEIVSKLYLPLGSYCCTIVEGPPVRVNKESDQEEVGILKSKMSASLECVKILHSAGKMDSDLDLTEEVYVDVDEKLQNFELEDEGKGRAGTNKRKRAYEIKVPSFFKDNMPRANETSFLYKIRFEDPTVYKHSKSGSLQSLSEPEFELGILSRKSLPKMPSFPIYTLKSDVTVSLQASDPVNIEETALSCIRLFHHYVFKHLHKLDTQSTMVSESDGYLAVPLVPNAIPCHGLQIHYQFLQEFASFFQSICDPDMKLKPALPCKDFSLFQNKIVRRLNESANQTHYTRYLVVKVCQDLSPDSPFPEPEVASSFAEYYQNRYGIQVDLEQPMLLVQHLPTQINFIIPRHRHQEEKSFQEGSIANERGPRMGIHLIPELCSILPLSASAWSLARYLPAVVSRLEALLRAHEMKVRILCGTGIGFRPNARGLSEEGLCVNDKTQNCGSVGEKNSMVCARFDGVDVDDDGGGGIDVDNGCKGSDGVDDGNNTGYGGHGLVNDYGDDAEYNGNDNGHVFGGSDSVGPSILLILHAITARSAGQLFHSEPLEVLGDSCLKLEVSLELFLTDLEKDEWSLSLYRSYLVSNHMLSAQGRRLGIPGYLSITPPDLTSTSLPPGFIIKPSQVMFGARKTSLNLYTHQVLGDKHVANCVEALIAAILLGCGRNAARKFLKWVGVTQYTLDELTVFYQRLQVQVDQSGGNHDQVSCVCPVDEERETMVGNMGVETRNGNSAPRQMRESLTNATKSAAVEELIEHRNLCDDFNVQDTKCAWMEIAKEEREMLAEKIHIKYDRFNSISALNHVISTEEKDNFEDLNLEAAKRVGILNTSEERELLSEDLNGRIDGNTAGSRTHDEVGEEGKYHEIPKNRNASQTVHPKSDHLTFSTRPIPRFDHIERELGYSFKNKLLLLQALVHSSYSRILSLVSESYQKMEYLGDAILDYLITLYIFNHFPHLNHGDMTDFRSALVNNFTMAFLAVQNNLHKSLRHLSPPLLDVICKFSQFLKEQEMKQGASWKTSVDAFVVGSPEVEESSVEVPKVLGDVFEAVVCALFLDSGMNLELVWKVLFPMFKPFIDYYKDNIPRSPVRVLKESFPDSDKVTFSLARLTLSRRYKSSVHVVGYGKFEAIGRTPKIAKAIVARKALQHIHNTRTT